MQALSLADTKYSSNYNALPQKPLFKKPGRIASTYLCRLCEDIRVAGVEDDHGRAAIQFSTWSAQFNLVLSVPSIKPALHIHYCPRNDERESWRAWRSLWQTLAGQPKQPGHDVHSSSDLRNGGVLPAMRTSFALPMRKLFSDDLYPNVDRPDFMTRAKREERVSEDFLFFLGAIFAWGCPKGNERFGRKISL